MIHPTIEKMARAICAKTCRQDVDSIVYHQSGDEGPSPSGTVWQIYGIAPAKSAARALLTAEPSEAVFREAMDKIWGREMDWNVVDFNKTRKFLAAINAAQMKEMGL